MNVAAHEHSFLAFGRGYACGWWRGGRRHALARAVVCNIAIIRHLRFFNTRSWIASAERLRPATVSVLLTGSAGANATFAFGLCRHWWKVLLVQICLCAWVGRALTICAMPSAMTATGHFVAGCSVTWTYAGSSLLVAACWHCVVYISFCGDNGRVWNVIRSDAGVFVYNARSVVRFFCVGSMA
jgi:hypothetical protein